MTAIGLASHLVFLPDRAAPRFFLWGPGAAGSPLVAGGKPERVHLADETLAPRDLAGITVPLLEALPRLASLTAAEVARAPASIEAWSLAAKLALDLVGRERIVPRVVPAKDDGSEARFAVALAAPEDSERVVELAKAFPLAAHAVPANRGRRGPKALEVWTPEALLRAFLDAAADVLVRAAIGLRTVRQKAAHIPWERRLIIALCGPDAGFEPEGFQERTLVRDLNVWTRPALGVEADAPRACFRLDFPDGDGPQADKFPLRFFLQAADDPSLLVPAEEVLLGKGQALGRLGHGFNAAEEYLLRALATAARLFPPIARGLREARPGAVLLEAAEAWTFLTEAAPAFAEAGMGVILPAELTKSGQRRLRLRMRVGGAAGGAAAGMVTGASGLSLESVRSFQWEAALAGDPLSAGDLAHLAHLKAPLVRFRGQWVAVDPTELEEVRRLVASGGGTLAAHEALAAALGGTMQRPETGMPIDVVADGDLAGVVARLRGGAGAGAGAGGPAVPRDFHGTLRPYQERGLGWLVQMAELGLGACLADDMGLGKTIQLLAFLLHRRQERTDDRRPTLLVCPTSVVGNWEREIARFAPALPIVRHYGPDRARSPAELAAAPPNAIVITSYGLLRRDAELLGAVDWSTAALDEAQNIKNAASRTARAARSLRASFRVALTGTPVENRLAELWSIFEYLNPRLLGPLETLPARRRGPHRALRARGRRSEPHARRPAVPPAPAEERPGDHPGPARQAGDEGRLHAHARAGHALPGRGRRDDAQDRILRGHPAPRPRPRPHHRAQADLQPPGALPRRGGAARRPLRQARASARDARGGGRVGRPGAGVHAVPRRWATGSSRSLADSFGAEVPFLHGGVARAARDAMVQRFQDDGAGPQIFVLSVKAGGTGLNLTAANHVFHFDRWWNPAVEDQATDRAYRIGQTKSVQVHKLLTAGTVEEKVDSLLDQKRDLASRIVGEGEQWITELDDGALRDLFALAPDAVVAGEESDRDESDGAAPAPAAPRASGRVAKTTARPRVHR